MDNKKERIIKATIKGVRKYGLDAVRVKNIGELADFTAGALYRYFDSKDDLIKESFVYVDKQVAELFNNMDFKEDELINDPIGGVRKLWQPYFEFWISHPDETIFYHRFRDSSYFKEFDRNRDVSYFAAFIKVVDKFYEIFPGLKKLDSNLLWIHVLTGTLLYAKYIVEGVLPNDKNTIDSVFVLLTMGLASYITR